MATCFSATSAAIARWPITPAAIGIARNAKPPRGPSGLDKRLLDLLPVIYFHVVFTLPHQLGPLALQNPRIVYGILFRAAAQTLLEVGETRLAARFGFLAVAAYLGADAAGSPAPALRRPRRRHRLGWLPLGAL